MFDFCSCDYNKYTMQYITTLGESFTKKKEPDTEMEDVEEVEQFYESDVEI